MGRQPFWTHSQPSSATHTGIHTHTYITHPLGVFSRMVIPTGALICTHSLHAELAHTRKREHTEIMSPSVKTHPLYTIHGTSCPRRRSAEHGALKSFPTSDLSEDHGDCDRALHCGWNERHLHMTFEPYRVKVAGSVSEAVETLF